MSWYNRYYEKIGKESKDITDELPFEIPDSWVWCRLQNLISINGGYAFKSENYVSKEKGVRVLRISDFDESGFNNKRPVYHPYIESMKPFELEENDIIMCMTGGTVGKSYYVNNLPEKMVVNQRVADIKMTELINKQYVYLFLLSPFIQKIIKESKNSTNDNISIVLINSFLIPVPSLLEQKRIVNEINKFEHLLGEYDVLEQQSTKLDTEIYDKLKKSILQYAIQGKLVPQDENDEPASVLLERIRAEKKAKLGKKYIESYIYKGDDNCYYEKVGGNTTKIDDLPFDIPDNWSWARLGEIFQHNTGKALNSSNTNGKKLPYITTSNVYWDRFQLSKLKMMPFTEAEVEKCTVSKGDLLVCEGGDIGRSAIWGYEYDICIQNHIHRLRANNARISNRFYLYVLYVYKHCGLVGGKGIGIQGLSSNMLDKLLIPVPPINEQIKIVQHLGNCLSKLKREI